MFNLCEAFWCGNILPLRYKKASSPVKASRNSHQLRQWGNNTPWASDQAGDGLFTCVSLTGTYYLCDLLAAVKNIGKTSSKARDKFYHLFTNFCSLIFAARIS